MSEALEQSGLREGYKEVQFGPKTLVVPSDWSTERFGDVFHRRRESIDEIDDETVKYVGLKHLDSGRLDINGYDEDGRERSSSRVFREGDVLFGKLRPNLNKAAIAPFSGVCSSDILPIYAEEDGRQQYLPYLMHSKLVRDRVVSTMEGTNLPRTSWDDLEKTLIPLPPLPEQRRIADILSTIDEQIQQTDEIIGAKQDLTQGLINELVKTGVQDSPDIREVQIGPKQVKIPTSWDLLRVDELVTDDDDAIRTGPFGSKLKKEYLVSEGVKVYEQSNVYDNDFTQGNRYVTQDRYESELTSYDANPGDVLITLQGTIGDASVLPENSEPGIINQKLMRVRVDSGICLPEYFATFFDESHLADFQIEAVSHGAVVSGLNISTISGIRVPLPPLQEQQKIVDTIELSKSSLAEERETKRQLRELKRGLMQDLLTGKVRVNID